MADYYTKPSSFIIVLKESAFYYQFLPSIIQYYVTNDQYHTCTCIDFRISKYSCVWRKSFLSDRILSVFKSFWHIFSANHFLLRILFGFQKFLALRANHWLLKVLVRFENFLALRANHLCTKDFRQHWKLSCTLRKSLYGIIIRFENFLPRSANHFFKWN